MAVLFDLGHATQGMDLRVPHPSRVLRRVGSYALKAKRSAPFFSSPLSFPTPSSRPERWCLLPSRSGGTVAT